MQRVLPRREELGLSAYWLGLSFMWNSIHPILLPVMLLSLAEHAKNTTYGMLTFGGLVIALIVQPIAGAVSDKTCHRLGKRRPWILLGTALAVASLSVMILARQLWLVAASYVLLQFSSNLAHGAAQGLIPDQIPVQRRGIAAGLKNLFDVTGIILAAVIAGRILTVDASRVMTLGLIIIGMLVSAALITCLGAHEPVGSEPLSAQWRPQEMRAEWHQWLTEDMRDNRAYGRLLLSRFCVLLGSFAVQSFALFYVRDVLQVEAPARLVGQLMAVIGISIALVAYPAGLLSERWGRKRLALLACALATLGLGLLVVLQSTRALGALGCLIGLAMGIFTSVNWAWATDLVPTAEAGKYLGFSNLATAGSAALARLLGPIIDALNRWVPHVGYSAIFVLATVSALVGLIITLSIPDKKTQPLHWHPPATWRIGARSAGRRRY